MQSRIKSFKHSRYQHLQDLGQGGFGHVFKAWDTQLDRAVAIKIVHKSSSDIEQEAKALAKVHAPNVVTIFDIVEWDEQPAIVMEFVDNARPVMNEALKHYNLADFLSFFIQLVEGVQAIHQENLLHGDVKLGNILVAPNGSVKLTDFGLAQLQHGESATHQDNESTQGSWECLSPEQLRGEQLTTATDLFALGIILYSAIYGQHPFIDNKEPDKTRKNILSPIKFNDLSIANTALSDLIPLCEMLLKHTPEKRPQIGEVLSFLLKIKSQSGHSANAMATETLDIELEKPASPWKIFSIIGGIGVVIIGVMFYLFSPRTMVSTLVIPTLVVNKTTHTAPDSASLLGESQTLAVLMDDEFVDAIVTHPERRLIPKREWLGDRDWQRVAKTLLADEILFSEVNCITIKTCEITVSLYSRKNEKVIDKKVLDVPLENILVATELIRGVADNLLGQKKQRSSLKDLSEEAVKQYAYLRDASHQLENEKVIAGLEAFIRKNPSFGGAKLALGKAYLIQYDKSQESGWLKKARGIAELISDSASGHELLFWILLEEQNFNDARTVLERLSRLPAIDQSYLVMNHASLLFKQGKKQEAVEYLSQYPDIRHNVRYYHFKSYMLESIGQYEYLLETTDEWLALNTDTSTINEYRLLAHLHLGNLDQGVALGKKMLEKSPNSLVFNNLGIMLLLQGKFSESITVFSELLALEPENRGVLLNLADAHKGQGSGDIAQQYYESFIDKTRVLEDLQWRDEAYLAMAYAHLNQPTKALLSLQQMSAKASAQNMSSDGMYYLLSSHIYALIHQDQAAFINGQKALESGQMHHWFALPWLSTLHDKLVRHSEGLKKTASAGNP